MKLSHLLLITTGIASANASGLQDVLTQQASKNALIIQAESCQSSNNKAIAISRLSMVVKPGDLLYVNAKGDERLIFANLNSWSLTKPQFGPGGGINQTFYAYEIVSGKDNSLQLNGRIQYSDSSNSGYREENSDIRCKVHLI